MAAATVTATVTPVAWAEYANSAPETGALCAEAGPSSNNSTALIMMGGLSLLAAKSRKEAPRLTKLGTRASRSALPRRSTVVYGHDFFRVSCSAIARFLAVTPRVNH
jgi:hypothetical protein